MQEMQGIGEEYEGRRAAAEGEYVRWQGVGNRLLGVFAVVVVLLLWCGAQVAFHGGAGWPVGAAMAAAVVLIVVMLRARGKAELAARVAAIYGEGLARVRGEKMQTGHTGLAFAEAGHLYADDLNVVGENSLFGMLATTRTAVGRRGLAGLLLGGVNAAEVRARQAAVRELAPMLDLRERIALLGRSAFEQLPADGFDVWLEQETVLPGWVRWAMLATTLAWVGMLIGGLVLHAPHGDLARNVLVVLGVQGLVAQRFREGVRAELTAAHKLAGQAEMLRDGLRVLRKEQFAAERLVKLQAEVEASERAIRGLLWRLELVAQRGKDWLYAVSLLLGLGTQVAASLGVWKQRHGEAMRGWLAAWAEFEALVALGVYAVEHEQNAWPEVVEGGVVVLEGAAMTHPLLRRERAVGNTVSLREEAPLLLISGSNMAGKSTLLRTVGAQAVLALAGSSVPAERLTLRAVWLGASLTVGDSLADGKSKFLAEVERLRALVELAGEHRGEMLFLIDEILSGTNSADRRVAAESVVRTLVGSGAVGAVSTHDLALAEIAEIAELRGRNVHMASPDADDPLRFDYLLKDGVNRTTNALAIVRMLGLG